MKTTEVIDKFKEAGFKGRAFGSTEKLVSVLDSTDEKEFRHAMCPYKGYPRRIHPWVCEWHREEKDPECLECKNNRSFQKGE